MKNSTGLRIHAALISAVVHAVSFTGCAADTAVPVTSDEITVQTTTTATTTSATTTATTTAVTTSAQTTAETEVTDQQDLVTSSTVIATEKVPDGIDVGETVPTDPEADKIAQDREEAIPVVTPDDSEQDQDNTTPSNPDQGQYYIDYDVSEINPYDINGSICYAEVASDNEYFVSVDGVVYSNDLKTLIWCPQNYNENKVIIPHGTESIGNYAFFSCRNISEIEMPDSVLEIGDNAFSYCTMKKIRISDNLKSVGNEAFLCCENLLEVLLPDTASYPNGYYNVCWAYSVFKECSSLETIRIPCNDVVACTDGPSDYPMFENSFSGCLSLNQFILSDNADNLTIYCDALATKSLSIICRMLPKSEMTSFAIPSNTEVLGEYTFEGCLNLKELIIQPYSGNNEREFQINGMSTILGCENLEKLVILEDIRIANIRPDDFPLLTIYTMKGSEADKYAKENGFPVTYIKDINDYLLITKGN